MKFRYFISVVFVLLLLCSCGDKVTPVAYTGYKASGTQYVSYYTQMSGSSYGHIAVFKDEEEAHKEFGSPDLYIQFFKISGVDVVDGQKYTLVDISLKPVVMTVAVQSSVYSASNKMYLNGTAIDPLSVNEGGSLVFLEYTDVPLLRTKKNGKIDYKVVNLLEYK